MLNSIQDVIRVLEDAARLGEDVDEPEGARYIQISETLVNEMLKALRENPRIVVHSSVNFVGLSQADEIVLAQKIKTVIERAIR